jgi:hypothetical protein
VGDQITWGYARLGSTPSNFYLYDAVGKTLIAYDDLEGDPDQISVVEFYACAIRTIIP